MLSTGINELDRILKGGFRRPTSIALSGPRASGKSTLASRIQESAMDKGLPGLYITYYHNPLAILRLWKRLGIRATQYAEKGLVRVFDPFSATHGISKDLLFSRLDEEWIGWRNYVDYIENPEDIDSYRQQQVAAIEKLSGTGGVNVIDTTNLRFTRLPPADAAAYFAGMETELGDMKQQSSIHIVDLDEGSDPNVNFVERNQHALVNLARVVGRDGVFRLTVEYNTAGPFLGRELQYTLGRSGFLVVH